MTESGPAASPRPDEDELIARYFRPLATDPGTFRLGDDCASLTPPPGEDLVLKTDAIAATVHFFPEDPWDAVAAKALRVNLSDLAAKGARPLGYLLALGLPADWREADLAAFSRGLAADQATYGVSLYGGDTIKSPAGLLVSITAIGALPTGRMVRRETAKPGDVLFASGTLGDAALGLQLRLDPTRAAAWGLADAEAAHLARRYLLPEPRLALAPAVLDHASASMDISDGLGLDLTRLCRVSKVTAAVETARLPVSAAVARALGADPGLMRLVVTGGDDYEILSAVAPERAEAFEAAAGRAGVPVARIGRIEAGAGAPRFLGADGAALAVADLGFHHF